MSNTHKPTLDGISHDIMPRVHAAADQAESFLQHGVEAMVHGTQSLQHSGQHAQEVTLSYIRREPVKAVLIAVAAGALTMAVYNLMAQRR